MSKNNKIIKLIDLGIKSYEETLSIQEKFFNDTIETKKNNRKSESNTLTDNYLLFVEHHPVITLGKSGKKDNLLLNNNELLDKGIEFYHTNRGGDITYHGIGQIVGYPIFDLDNFFTDIHKYLRFLEEVIILTLAEYGLSADRSQGETGVWLDVGKPNARKICAMGVKASRWVTMHGFALNVNTDLSFFDYIIPCGIKGKSVTSLKKELGKEIPLNDVKVILVKHFEKLFEATIKKA